MFTCLLTVQADLLCMYGTRPRSGPPAHAFGSINTSSPRPRCPCASPDCTRGKYNTGFTEQQRIRLEWRLIYLYKKWFDLKRYNKIFTKIWGVYSPLRYCTCCSLVILLENTGLVSIVMLMILNCIFQQDQIKLLNYLSYQSVKNVKDWMTNNFLLLNLTEILLIGPKNSTQNLVDYNLHLDGYCYFLYSQKFGCYIRQQIVFWKSNFPCYKNSILPS